MARQSFFVELSVPIAEFRSALATAIPQAVVPREFSATRIVVVVPEGLAHELSGLAGVTSVTPDEIRHTLPRGHTGDSRA